MIRKLGLTLACCALALLPLAADAAPMYFDFGADGTQAGGNYNNIVMTVPQQLSIADAIDSTGASTGVGLTVSGFYANGPNNSGPTSPTGDAAIFDPEATRDNAFGNGNVWGGNPATPAATLAFTGLDPAKTYAFDFFGSRIPASNNRETMFTATGLNSASAALNPSNNSSEIATIMGIAPTAGGTLDVVVAPGPNNDSAELFYYLGAMRVTAVPEPATMALAAFAAGCVALLRRR
ncbi:MAG: hypothetical protein CMJ58_08985 [Planctomycetaceae bacterium]|nr:hypothetical protein [Planctomycetaceae bacterium]